MKKLFLAFFLVPLFSLADDQYYFSNYWQYNGSSTTSKSFNSVTSDFNTVQLVACDFLRAVRMSPQSGVFIYNPQSVSSNTSFPNFIRRVGDDSSCVPFANCSLLIALDSIACGLVYMGFTNFVSSTQVSTVYQFQSLSSSYFYFNCRVLSYIGLALSSTNTSYRSFVLDRLSSISSDVRSLLFNSSLGLDSFRSFVDDYSKVNFYSLSPTSLYSNAEVPVVDENPLFWYGSTSYPYSDVLSDLRDGFLLFDDTPGAAARRAFVSQATSSIFSDALRAYLLDQSSGVNKPFQSYVEDPSAAMQSISGHYNTPLTNEMRRMSADWKEATTNALAQNTASITNQLQEWKRQSGLSHDDTSNRLERIGTTLGDVKDYSKNVSDLLSGNNPNKAHVIVDNDAVPVNVMNWPNTLELKFTANDLDVLVNANAATSKELLDNLTNRIDSITNAVSGLPDYLASLSNLIFQLDFDVTNAIGDIVFPSNVFSSSFSALLLDDYSNFVENAWVDFSSNLEENFPDLYSGLSSFGFDSSDRYGRWWSYASSSLGLISSCCQSNTFFLSRLMSDIAELDTVFDEHFGSDVFSQTRRILSSFPSETQINDYIDQCTNSTSAVSGAFDRFNVSLFSLSNSYDSVFAPFKGQYTSVPPSLTIMKTANEKYFTIPVGDQPRVWLFLRYGISFGLVAVNLLLLPKYLLMLFTIFSRVVLHGHRILPGDR